MTRKVLSHVWLYLATLLELYKARDPSLDALCFKILHQQLDRRAVLKPLWDKNKIKTWRKQTSNKTVPKLS